MSISERIAVSVAALLLAGSALAQSVPAAPASAVTYDLYDSFNGLASAGNFNFIQFQDSNLNARSPLNVAGTCYPGLQCLRSAFNGVTSTENNLYFAKNVSGATVTAGSYVIPASTLTFTPGKTYDAGVIFVAPTTGYYRGNAAFSLTTTNTPTGVKLSNYKLSSSGVMTKLSDFLLSASKRSDSASGTIFLNAGEGMGFGINSNGTLPTSNDHDSTSISYQIEAIPEPASWMLLIAGFGMTGAVLRRRPTPAAA